MKPKHLDAPPTHPPTHRPRPLHASRRDSAKLKNLTYSSFKVVLLGVFPHQFCFHRFFDAMKTESFPECLWSVGGGGDAAQVNGMCAFYKIPASSLVSGCAEDWGSHLVLPLEYIDSEPATSRLKGRGDDKSYVWQIQEVTRQWPVLVSDLFLGVTVCSTGLTSSSSK